MAVLGQSLFDQLWDARNRGGADDALKEEGSEQANLNLAGSIRFDAHGVLLLTVDYGLGK